MKCRRRREERLMKSVLEFLDQREKMTRESVATNKTSFKGKLGSLGKHLQKRMTSGPISVTLAVTEVERSHILERFVMRKERLIKLQGLLDLASFLEDPDPRVWFSRE